MFLTDIGIDARTAIRILCGLWFLPHTFAKLTNIGRASQLFDKVGLRPSRFFVVFTSAMELIAAISLVTGIYPKIGALIAAIILIVAAYAIAKINGFMWRWQHPGVEYMVFWACICLLVTYLP